MQPAAEEDEEVDEAEVVIVAGIERVGENTFAERDGLDDAEGGVAAAELERVLPEARELVIIVELADLECEDDEGLGRWLLAEELRELELCSIADCDIVLDRVEEGLWC